MDIDGWVGGFVVCVGVISQHSDSGGYWSRIPTLLSMTDSRDYPIVGVDA